MAKTLILPTSLFIVVLAMACGGGATTSNDLDATIAAAVQSTVEAAPTRIESAAPTPAPTVLPTPDSPATFEPLAERFKIWKSQWIGTYGEPPYSITGTYSSSLTINLPMCGVVIGNSGSPGYLGFDSAPSATLGHQEVALIGGHVLKGSGFNNRGYTLDVRPPELLGQDSVTTEYNNQLRTFLDLCGG